MSKRHKHADLIHAFAEGAEIQKFDYGKWWDDPFPKFFPENKYRIKPRTVKREGWVAMFQDHQGRYLHGNTFDTKDAAKHACPHAVDVIKIEWEEEA